MIIHFERSGGFTAIPMKLIVDTASLQPDQNQELTNLVETSQFFNLPEKVQAPPGGNDRFQFKLTIEAGQRKHTVEAGESGLPDSLQPLIQRLTLMARTSRTK